MYLAYQPPQMLPTQTLNPTATATVSGGAKSTGKVKRGLNVGELPKPLNTNVLVRRREPFNADKWWWVGVGVTGVGGVAYYCF